MNAMINLGPYSGADCPNVQFKPTIIERVLEVGAFLVLLATWGSIYWLYTKGGITIPHDALVSGGMAIVTFIILGACAYVPVRLVHFPVRVNEYNVGIQYVMAVRLVRVLNILIELMFLAGVYINSYPKASLFYSIAIALVVVALVVHQVIARKYK